jgi:PAS domain S-box-containing protein
MDMNETILCWGVSAVSLYGFSEAEALGQVKSELLQSQLSDNSAEIGRLLTIQGYWDGVVKEKSKEGRRLIVTCRRQIFENGSQQLMLEQSRGVCEETLHEEVNLQAEIIQNSNDAITSWSKEEGILTWNMSASNLYGYAFDEAVGRFEKDLLKSNYPVTREQLFNVLDTEGSWCGEILQHSKDGKLVVVSSYIFSTYVGINRVYVAINQDVTEQQGIQREMKRFRQLIDSSLDAIISWTEEGGIQTWNQGAVDLFGWSAVEVLGKMPQHVVKSELPMSREDIFHIIEKEGAWSGAVKVWTKDGDSKVISSLIQVTKIGQQLYYVAIDRDISLEHQSHLRMPQLNALVSASRDAVCVWSPENGIMEWNRGAEIVYGYTSNEAYGRSPRELLQSSITLTRPQLIGILKQEGEWRGELHELTKSGRKIIVQSHLQAIGGSNQLLVLAINRDVTDERELKNSLETVNNSLKHSNEKMGSKNQELEQYAYVASHDLQEPLRAVVGFMQLLKQNYSDGLEPEAVAYIDKAIGGGKRMSELIKGLLQHARITEIDVEFKKVPLNLVLNEVVEDLEQSIRDNAAEINIGPLPKVYGGHDLLVQLFRNLVSNSLKFSGSNAIKIEIEAIDLPDTRKIVLSDNGIGISLEFHEQVFSLFKRLHSRSKYDGHGLGLAICRKIVERHGGTIGIDSAYTGGTRIEILFPNRVLS